MSVRCHLVSGVIMLVAVVVGWIPSANCGDDSHAVDRSREALQVRQGYRVEIAASDPLVVDPVSARLDHRGRLWVVEMPDYPLGPRAGDPPSGRIKILRDIDLDGRFDTATVFADGLMFATGLQPYGDGAFVTLAGAIVRMRDTDDDGVADQTIVLFKGFAEQNQQLRANHPTLGPDGMIYVAGGLRGGVIRSVDQGYPAREKPLDLRDSDFWFDPEGGDWDAVAGKSQFGLTIDDYGRRLGCSNRNPAMMTPLSIAAIRRDPLLAARDAIADVALAAEKSKVVSRAHAWTTSNLHSGQFSAACGVYAPGIFDSQGEWLLACEPTAYLVQRQRIIRHGSVWQSRRESEQAEFLSSSDTWFRPVDITAGPGQTVYVVDMSRAVIEHPDFMPTELKARPDQWDGGDLGRIWQIAEVGSETRLKSIDSSEDALKWLQSDSPWQRQAATQFLLERDLDVDSPLRQIILSDAAPSPSRARAALLLKRKQRLSNRCVRSLMKDGHARLRALGIRLTADRDGLLDRALAMSAEQDSHVLRQVAALAAQDVDHPEQRVAALVKIALAADDSWIHRTVASARAELLVSLVNGLVAADCEHASLLGHLVERIAIASPESAAEVVAGIFARHQPGLPLDSMEAETLDAWVSGVKRGRRSVRTSLDSLAADAIFKEVLSDAFLAASKTAEDDSVSASIRAACLRLSAEAGQPPQDLRELLADRAPPLVRMAALPLLLQREREWTHDFLREHLSGMTINLRSAAIAACSRSVSDTKWLLSEISGGSIPKTMIDPTTAKRLRQHSNEEIKREAERLFRSDPNRASVLKRYASAAKNLGDPIVGKQLFVQHCSACHQVDGVGTNVGPDISDSRSKTPEALLTSILDPNAAIDSSFIQYNVLRVDGRVVDGLLIDETSDAITLQQKGGKRVTIAREDIEALQAPGVSLMPEGFEQSLSVETMSHLLSYLKNWRYLRTSIPGTLSETK